MIVTDYIHDRKTRKIIEKIKTQKDKAKLNEIIAGLWLDDKEAGILATTVGNAYLKEKNELKKQYFKGKLYNAKYFRLKLRLYKKYIPLAVQELDNFRFGLNQFRTARGTIIVIADSHVNEMWAESAPALLSFLDYIQESRSDVSDIVLLGDIFDFQRGLDEMDPDTRNLWREIIFIHEMGNIHLHYIYGNHDYILFPARIGKLKLPPSDFFPFTPRDKLTLKSGGKAFLFEHGHELEKYPKWFYSPTSRAGGAFGTYIGPLLEKGFYMVEFVVGSSSGKSLESTIDLNEYERYVEGLKGYDMLIHGHTELPYKKKKVACPGSWNVRTDGVRTFMEIQNGEIKIRRFFNKNRIETLPNSILSNPEKPSADFIDTCIKLERERWGVKKYARKKWGPRTLVQIAQETGDEAWKQRQEAQKAKTENRKRMLDEAWEEVKKEETSREKEELEQMEKMLDPVIKEEREKEKEKLKRMARMMERK